MRFGSTVTAKRMSSAYDVTQKLIGERPKLGLIQINDRTSRLQIDMVAKFVLVPAGKLVNQRLV